MKSLNLASIGAALLGSGTKTGIAEGLGVLALAADAATGRPQGSGLTAAIVAAEFSRRLGDDVATQKDAYYIALVRFIGCTITSHETGMMSIGDDQGFAVATMLGDWADRADLKKHLAQFIALDAPSEDRDAAFESICDMIPLAAPDFTAAHCRQSYLLAKRLPISQAVLESIPFYYGRWDSKVLPYGGESLPYLQRLHRITEMAELVRRLYNATQAKEVIAAKLGHEIDPNLGAKFLEFADDIFEVASKTPEFENFIAAEPGDRILMTPTCRETLAEIAADMTDHKAVCFRSHSRRVSSLAAQAGKVAKLSKGDIENLRLAALVHDIGKCAISNRIWYKETELAVSERLEMERHTYQTQFYLSHGDPFSKWVSVAASVQERADGSGYHRGIRLSDLASNILAVANEYDELTHGMPNRPALSADQAANALNATAREKVFPAVAVSSVLQAAGHKVSDAKAAYPFGLTRREAQVLSRLAKSETTAEIAEALGISPKTADHHIQSIYNKTDVRARPALALLALEHGIVMD
ncbi:HD domain-containing phosphohydrolase [Actibacterium pelagium]|uniref:3'3'-cGAMP-specific phosphodiesterase 3 n=1 Tax=Actibacterium pelagium TaxID=2029103 RepID=A0A917AHG1_9RHOB|nr:HD domain-containing phosphohydrolase [Actibacterium pelagium]GGE53220.1 3'3'-cGAMP-specific phosphodiesterase 3 [Actibacterium pelagium]